MSAPRRSHPLGEQALRLIREAGERSKEIEQRAQGRAAGIQEQVAAQPESAPPDPTRCASCCIKLTPDNTAGAGAGALKALCPACEHAAPKVCPGCQTLYNGQRDQCN